jgi:hypothetical protein
MPSKKCPVREEILTGPSTWERESHGNKRIFRFFYFSTGSSRTPSVSINALVRPFDIITTPLLSIKFLTGLIVFIFF